MIKGQCILCMPLTTWDSSFTNTVVKMMSILSKENKILFVDYQYSVKDVFNTILGKKYIPLKRIMGVEPRLRKVLTEFGSEIYVLSPPPVLPSNGISSSEIYKFIIQLNASIVKSAITKALQDLQIENPVVVNGYNPFLGLPLIGAFNERLHVYYCYDEIRGDIWYKNHGPAIEEKYMKKVDLVIATSDALHESKSCINPNCFVVKNGVDFELFNSARSHRSLTNRKVVAYTGSVDERFDTELMRFVIEESPSIDFEFLGRVTNPSAKDQLEKFPNVTFLGSRSPKEVPEYLKGVNACIIPYLKNEVTWGVYPLKINEYLAAGKPVVMTSFAPLKEFEGVVSQADTKENFLELLHMELNSDSTAKIDERVALARNNSWENRVETFSEIIEMSLLKRREVLV